ncbi:hypothetical protein D9757_009105 [Collybiopsis confluens]|uniref:Uncharacterized protein n=1 Tax=Collybiopsis confluens TaxID=2823264 RepID=A0A8H5H998_9AGAR|nr:hypothetical protein D9757_009105 [Collybiopsis confluens]
MILPNVTDMRFRQPYSAPTGLAFLGSSHLPFMWMIFKAVQLTVSDTGVLADLSGDICASIRSSYYVSSLSNLYISQNLYVRNSGLFHVLVQTKLEGAVIPRVEECNGYPQESQRIAMAPSPIPDAPRFVAYSDNWDGQTAPPPVANVKGFNVFANRLKRFSPIKNNISALCFLLTTGAYDRAKIWQDMTQYQRETVKSEYKAAGVSLIVSAFGSTETPTTSGVDPIAMADQMAKWVIANDLDGIDVNYEDFPAFDAGTAEVWLVKFTKQLRQTLPKGKYILTHAQGADEYATCAGLLTESSSTFPKTALFQIHDNAKVPLKQLVICKPATSADANSGYMDPGTLATCLSEAKKKDWSAGVTVWQWPHAQAAWIKEVRSKSWPVN